MLARARSQGLRSNLPLCWGGGVGVAEEGVEVRAGVGKMFCNTDIFQFPPSPGLGAVRLGAFNVIRGDEGHS